MYSEEQIETLMELRHKRWALLSDKIDLHDYTKRKQLDGINRQLSKLTGKHQYL